ncbi:MAG: hypothetical protein H7296_14260 [Bacteroidia bacterium]|nr:hypothetical protein [Bacteroidia bacterium]
MGVQKRSNRFSLEVIAGMGYRIAEVLAGLKKFRDYSMHPWDYGYNSFIPYELISFGIYLF